MEAIKHNEEKVLTNYKGWVIRQKIAKNSRDKRCVEYEASLSLNGCLMGVIEIDYEKEDVSIAIIALKQAIDIEETAGSLNYL